MGSCISPWCLHCLRRILTSQAQGTPLPYTQCFLLVFLAQWTAMLYYHLFHTQENSLERFTGPARFAQIFNMYLFPGRKKKKKKNNSLSFYGWQDWPKYYSKIFQANTEQMRKICFLVKWIFGDWIVSQGRCYNKVKSWTLLGHWNLNCDDIVLKHMRTCRTYLLVTE